LAGNIAVLGLAEEYYLDEMDDWYAEASSALNVCTFTATLVERDADACGLLGQAIRWLDDGIERPYDDEHRHRAREWELYLPAATAWILVAGKSLCRACLQDKDVHYQRLSEAQWVRWRTTLDKLSGRRDFGDDYRDLAARTAGKMANIEEEYRSARSASFSGL
jgi:hypothetical protein